MKCEAKDLSATFRVEKYKTGGGVNECPDIPAETERTLSIISKDIQPLQNKHDGDAVADEKIDPAPKSCPKRPKVTPSDRLLEMKEEEHAVKMRILALKERYWLRKTTNAALPGSQSDLLNSQSQMLSTNSFLLDGDVFPPTLH